MEDITVASIYLYLSVCMVFVFGLVTAQPGQIGIVQYQTRVSTVGLRFVGQIDTANIAFGTECGPILSAQTILGKCGAEPYQTCQSLVWFSSLQRLPDVTLLFLRCPEPHLSTKTPRQVLVFACPS
jgi:hypothetical protein